jgi:hypothetical protein
VTETIERPAFAPAGEPCVQCGTPLARDQRYCLSCGARRAGLPAMLSADPHPRPATVAVTTTTPAPPPPESPWRLDLGLIAGVGCLLLALLVGVLIGRSGHDESQRAAAPQVVTVGAAPTATATATATAAGSTTAPVSFTSDWPAGKKGFTVQLQTLPKDGTDAAAVAAAKQAATGKGAADVGALDSDQFSSLDGGQYVVYSGQFADKKAASDALKDLRKDFPDAKLIEVSDTDQAAASPKKQAESSKAIDDLQNASGDDYSKKSAKLPDDIVTPGTPPPKDDKPAGGGSDVETFP